MLRAIKFQCVGSLDFTWPSLFTHIQGVPH
jgi:hypothetical protein